MLKFKDMRFPIDVILVFIRWDAAYPLSYRHLEEMMEERACRLTIRQLTDPQSAFDRAASLRRMVAPMRSRSSRPARAQAPYRKTLRDQ